jgi:cyclophilin family peptidyl-prolyl cis-trans isomerase
MWIVLLAALMAPADAQGGGAAPAPAKAPRVTLETSKGKIVIELYPDKAPVTVANFLEYARAGFYDGTIFHRVIPDFMIQGGGFTADMGQKGTRGGIKNEADNGLRNTRGSLAMARTNDPHSASAQWFINLKNNGFLDKSQAQDGWGYAVFGKVVEGMDVVDEIARVATTSKGGHQNVPREAVVITKATVE